MKYIRFLIGEHKLPLLVDPMNPDVILMHAQGDEIGPYDVRLPETNEMAEALGRLIFRGPRYIPPVDPDLIAMLRWRVDELDLSVRAKNCMENMGIEYVWQLVEKSANDLIARKHLGMKSLKEIREMLQGMGLSLDMKISDDLKRVLPNAQGTI